MSRGVVIIGGGVAGLEALLALQDLAGGRAELTLVAPNSDFVYKPLLVEEPFDLGPAEQHALAPLADELGAGFVQKAAKGMQPAERTLELDDGSTLDYDFLIVCAGGRFRPALESARTFPSGGEPLRINELLQGAEGQRAIAFVVPSGVTWALPIYEIALMTQRRALELRVDDVQLTIVRPRRLRSRSSADGQRGSRGAPLCARDRGRDWRACTRGQRQRADPDAGRPSNRGGGGGRAASHGRAGVTRPAPGRGRLHSHRRARSGDRRR